MKPIKYLLIISILFFTTTLFSQNSEIETLVSQGIEYHDKGDYKKAIEIYKKALKLDPNSSLANYEISFSYFSDNDFENAEKYSKKVIDMNNGNLLAAYITYGSSIDMLGRKKEAILAYETAMKDFSHYLLYYNHALTCFSDGQADKAYESVIKAIQMNPSHASSHLILSKIMESKGSRAKAMLPLYYFLLLEPTSPRASKEYETLLNYIDYGVTQDSEKNINVKVPITSDSEFEAAEMSLSLSKASNNFDENREKPVLELFSENSDTFFKVLGEIKKDNTGFWWDFYVSFFSDIASNNFTKPFCYYISLSQKEAPIKWLNDNKNEFEKFSDWLKKK